MTRKREFLDYVADIEDAARSISQFIAGMSWTEFARDRKTIFAVVRAFEIIGEAAKKVPPSVRKRHPKVPWRLMAGMRDKLIHEYFGLLQLDSQCASGPWLWCTRTAGITFA